MIFCYLSMKSRNGCYDKESIWGRRWKVDRRLCCFHIELVWGAKFILLVYMLTEIRLKIQRSLLVHLDQKRSYFYACFYKNSIRDRSFCSATFGRSISDEVKISYADDIGVWFSGLNVCNFRRILLIHSICYISRCLKPGGIVSEFGGNQYL